MIKCQRKTITREDKEFDEYKIVYKSWTETFQLPKGDQIDLGERINVAYEAMLCKEVNSQPDQEVEIEEI